MRRVMLASMWLFAVASSAAHASGGFGCEAADGQVELLFESGMTRGMGSPVFNFRGSATITSSDVTEDLRRTEFEGAHLAQYWSEDDQLNLVIYRERAGDQPHGYVQIVIRTQGEDGVLRGRYELTAFDGLGEETPEGKTYTATGSVECLVE